MTKDTFNTQEDDRASRVLTTTKKYGVRVGAGLLAFMAAYGSYFTVNPTERANVRRLGVVQYSTPLTSGLHFKLPFIDTVDTLTVSQRNIVIPTFKVSTKDNQVVSLDLSYNFDIPDACVNKLLYNLGNSGNQDIEPQLEKITVDRAGFVFAPEGMATLNTRRSEVQGTLDTTITNALRDQFCVHVDSVQMKITPSDTFLESNAAAVNQINLAAAANNAKITKQAEADQLVITAKGQADSAAATADGERRAAIAASEGRLAAATNDANATRVKATQEGIGEQARLQAEIAAFGGKPDLYIRYLEAQSHLRWDGKQPQIVAGTGSSANLIFPMAPLTRTTGSAPATLDNAN